jgi:hypothetical protein
MQQEEQGVMELKPRVVSGPTARQLLDIGNTKYWDLVKAGKIKLVKLGGRGRGMATMDSIETLVADAERSGAAQISPPKPLAVV